MSKSSLSSLSSFSPSFSPSPSAQPQPATVWESIQRKTQVNPWIRCAWSHGHLSGLPHSQSQHKQGEREEQKRRQDKEQERQEIKERKEKQEQVKERDQEKDKDQEKEKEQEKDREREKSCILVSSSFLQTHAALTYDESAGLKDALTQFVRIQKTDNETREQGWTYMEEGQLVYSKLSVTHSDIRVFWKGPHVPASRTVWVCKPFLRYDCDQESKLYYYQHEMRRNQLFDALFQPFPSSSLGMNASGQLERKQGPPKNLLSKEDILTVSESNPILLQLLLFCVHVRAQLKLLIEDVKVIHSLPPDQDPKIRQDVKDLKELGGRTERGGKGNLVGGKTKEAGRKGNEPSKGEVKEKESEMSTMSKMPKKTKMFPETEMCAPVPEFPTQETTKETRKEIRSTMLSKWEALWPRRIRDVDAQWLFQQVGLELVQHLKPSALLVFLKLRYNCFSIDKGEPGKTTIALMLICLGIANHVNYSCSPNLHWVWSAEKGQVVFQTVAPLVKDDELTVAPGIEHGYCSDILETRQKSIYSKWGFTCRCAICATNQRYSQASPWTRRNSKLCCLTCGTHPPWMSLLLRRAPASSDLKLLYCKCQKAWYCSKECQKEHWGRYHKFECTARRKSS